MMNNNDIIKDMEQRLVQYQNDCMDMLVSPILSWGDIAQIKALQLLMDGLEKAISKKTQ